MTLILRKPWNRQPPAGTYATPSSAGSNGLVAYLPGTAPYDASPHRRAITSTTHAPSIPTREGLAYNFNGTSHQFNVACPFLSEFTCVCWVYYNESLGNNDSYYNIFSRGAVFENNTNFAIGIRQNAGGTFQARLFMYARNGASLVGAESANNVIVNNNWYRVVWTWKSGSQGAWVNGVRVITATATNGADGAQPLIFGGANSYTSTDRRAQYPLLDMRVYSRAWSDAEVNWDWTEGRSAWTPFSPRRILIPVAAAGGAPTITALSARLITTTSAQPRISYS